VGRYQHPELGFAFDLPERAEVVLELPPTVAIEPSRDWWFTPTCVVTAEPRTADSDRDEWVDAGLTDQVERLTAAWLIDRLDVASQEPGMVRTLVHHAVHDHPVTLEQWWLEQMDRRWVLSASCSTLDYPEVAPAFASLAASFEARAR